MDDVFGLSGNALQLCEDRTVLLTNNIANASTPHYKAKDLDFHSLLQKTNIPQPSLARTQAHHLNQVESLGGNNVMYRIPQQNNLDGNTVDEQMERKNFIENALHYQMSLTFIQNKTEELKKAFKGV